MIINPILNSDSYKLSHWAQYPPGTQGMYSYVAARGGTASHVLFFGLQSLLKDYLSQRITREHIDEAEAVVALHGLPFNRAGFERIVQQHDGYWPVRIRAVAEGELIPTGIPMITIESTDPELFWVVSFLETALLRVWYPISVATRSFRAKEIIRRYLQQTADDLSGLPFKLHDFGARGVSSYESSEIGGLAHLVNFQGSDTLAALVAARRHYHEPCAAFSIPAAEHSTITAWGRAQEGEAFANMLTRFAKPGALLAVVSDSYDVFHAVSELWGERLRQQVIDSGATVVIRPDSGEPVQVVAEVVERLAASFGTTVNSKGYRVLNHVRVIQGDGVNLASIDAILSRLAKLGYSADNVAFGMGAELLQKLDRDTHKMALKCSAICINGEWRDVFKDPVTDPGKRSLGGRVVAARDSRAAWGVNTLERVSDIDLQMHVVWENGRLLVDETLADIRARAALHLEER
ncbi:nicotinate phosphoribosyltransferase [Vogesella sp. DC21W]|uniref:Nicotinamide phosphoribosyltransferase n=1 Tax=Vogesella aquatica TaxID=2984206 RepID=A0ABT5IV30_9NEIS|nr:nicotinate phosphoribosyltransferase [Vogesella aquatica]MDC7716372.1 nicotinate phosphoribosyltransferase [Vogesella aquatica]